MNKRPEIKKSKDNSSGAANYRNNKNKESNQNKKDQKSNTNSSVNIIFLHEVHILRTGWSLRN